MVALVIVSTFVVLMLGILVAGLLRSHADILRALHDLGAGVGDPSTAPAAAPVTFTPPAPGLGQASELGVAPAIAGVTPTGDARAVAVDNSDDFTLLGFLSSGCTGCAAFWDALQEPGLLQLPDRTRVVIVTKGPDREIPAEVQAKATGRVPVVMSTDAWLDYQVPGSPFFVLVDGATGRKVGQGVASQVSQLAELVRRAEHDRGHAAGTRGRGEASLAGPGREAAADEILTAAGILPGDPSLYPRTLHDVFPHRNPVPAE
jgi:hypothetical protein